MGKSQKKRATRRHNPIRVPDSHLPHGLATASSISSKSEAVLPILQKLGSADAVERTWACAAVSNLIQNDPSTRRLFQGKNIVGELITRLTDATEEVVVEAAGALRNLCVDGGYDICAEMYNKNIMAPLRTFPAKISTTLHQFLENPKESPDGARRLVYEFAENVITIFWCLSETSNKALRAVNDAQLAPFLMAFLQARERLPSSTVIAAAQCLYVLTEENDPTISDLRAESSFIACLLDISRNDLVTPGVPGERNKEIHLATLRVLVSGILNNISPLPSVISASSIDLENKVILPLLVPQLSIDLNAAIAAVMHLLINPVEEDVTSKNPLPVNTPLSDHKTPREKELDCVEEKLRITQLSLEILTSICAKIPEPIPPFEDEIIADSQMDDGMDSEEADLGIVDQTRMQPLANGTGIVDPKRPTISWHSINSLLSTLTRPLIALVHPTPLSFPSSPAEPSPHPPTTSALSTIHIRALECLNNMFLAVEDVQELAPDHAARPSPEVVEGIKFIWNELWQALGKIGTVVSDSKIFVPRGSERKVEMWDIAVGVMWGVAKLGRGNLVPDAEQVRVLMEFCDASTEDQVKVKCIGALECLAQFREAIDANKMISVYILRNLSSPSLTYVESCIQSAAALIDIYSDESAPYDINFRQGQLVDELAHALPVLRKVVRSVDRRKPGGMELRGRGDEVLENLGAFIKYRRALKF